ncbi:MAG: sugar ABC transporter permease [Anaerolineales bacterium]|nr:sugar ABC transporter permease [Anaerolineales bacterium]
MSTLRATVKRFTDLRHFSDREDLLGPIFLLPAVAYILLLVGIPTILALAFSLTDVTVGDTSLNFVGLRNFRNVVRAPQFQRALINSVAITVVSQIVVGILATILAVLLAEDFRGKWFARFLIILPWATPISLATIGWLWLLDSTLSPLDWVFKTMGLLGTPGALFGVRQHMNFLGREWLAMGSVTAVHIWRVTPLATIIVVAGLTAIPDDLIDQARVDGATFWKILFDIKLPLIFPITTIALLFGTIFTFTDMTIVYILTRGGPVYYTQVLPVWAFFKGIEGGSLAEGAAIALFMFPVLLAGAIAMLRMASRAEVA